LPEAERGRVNSLFPASHTIWDPPYIPFFSSLPLEQHGLHWIWPEVELAHPLDDGTAVLLHRDIRQTAAQFGSEGRAWERLFTPLVKRWKPLVGDVFAPPHIPHHPFLMANFGLRAVQPIAFFARNSLRNPRAQALFAGAAAHSALKFTAPLGSAFGLVLVAAGHAVGWPVPQGGAQNLSNALIGVLQSLGGKVLTGARVERLAELDGYDLKLCDITPRQLLALCRDRLSRPYRQLLERYVYGPGVYKVDWALREPIPWTAQECRKSITVHLGGSIEEFAVSEQRAWDGMPPEKPFVLLAQPSLYDATRAPVGRHTAWAYCHVPNGWSGSALEQIENQIERFAPGFRECILARAAHSTRQMHDYNENLVGGDVNAGAFTVKQFAMRPTWRGYSTPIPGLYLCSASTPPGGAVHGLCGYHAARAALRKLKASE
jgi:phytoene dehydrogenase-like protein